MLGGASLRAVSEAFWRQHLPPGWQGLAWGQIRETLRYERVRRCRSRQGLDQAADAWLQLVAWATVGIPPRHDPFAVLRKLQDHELHRLIQHFPAYQELCCLEHHRRCGHLQAVQAYASTMGPLSLRWVLTFPGHKRLPSPPALTHLSAIPLRPD